MTQYFRWLIGVVCTQNFDGFVHNYALYVNEQGRFQVLPWDYDATWGRDIHGEEMPFDYIPVNGFNTLTARLLDIPSFKRAYYTLFQHVLATHFVEDRLCPIIEKWHESIEDRIGDDPYTKDRKDILHSERDLIRQYINKRRRYLQTEIKKRYLVRKNTFEFCHFITHIDETAFYRKIGYTNHILLFDKNVRVGVRYDQL